METLSSGDQAPWFAAATLDGGTGFSFATVGGHAVLLMFAGSLEWQPCAEALKAIDANRLLLDQAKAVLFGISIDPTDVSAKRITRKMPGIRWFLDHDLQVSELYGAATKGSGGQNSYSPHFLLLDHRLRVVQRFGIREVEAALAAAMRLAISGAEVPTAPVLVVPRVFEPEFCRRLIDVYEKEGGKDSGYMQERDGMMVGVVDHSFKRRSDHEIGDTDLKAALMMRMYRHLLPEIERALQFRVTRIERWTLACYDSSAGGFFKPHRDNISKATAHRRFACSINLNAEDYEGGDLCFPEYGPRLFRPPTGGALIFSCSLLHEAKPVSAGKRYAFLPFFYDEKDAELREQNLQYLASDPEPAGPEAGS